MDLAPASRQVSFLEERSARLDRLIGRAKLAATEIEHGFPLLKVIRLPATAVALLQDAARLYLWENLTARHGERAIAFSPTILEDHSEEILALPNRTPNGLIQPKRPALASFNMLHRVLALTFRQLGLTGQFEAIQLPVNVRVVGGMVQVDADSRPYSSSKIHTDTWNREPLSALLFNLPLLGDPARIGIRYYAFREPRLELFQPLPDYSASNLDPAGLVAYDAPFTLGRLYVSDQTSLHQTVRQGIGGIRLSLDFRAVMRELVAHESHDVSQSSANYADGTVWDGLGSATLLSSDQPIDAFQRKQRGEPAGEAPVETINVDQLISS